MLYYSTGLTDSAIAGISWFGGLTQSGTPWYQQGVALNGINPSLYYDFTSNRYYDTSVGLRPFPFTSVRTTNATQFDSLGRLVWAPANMFANSNPVSGVFGAPQNATSTLDTTYASPTGSPVYKLVASNGFSLTGNNGDGGIASNAVTTVSGNTYAISFYARAGEVTEARIRESVSTGYRATISLLTGAVATESGTGTLTGGMVVTSQDAGAGWWRIICKRTVSTTSQTFNIKVGGLTGDGVSGIYISSCQFEPDDATAPKPFVATTSTAYYGPRFDYNPTDLSARGLLVELSSTNVCLLSQTTSANWSPAFGNMSDVGTQWGFNISRFTTTSTGGGQFTFVTSNAFTPSASTIYTISAFAKKGNFSRIQVSCSNNHFSPAVAEAYLNYNFDTNTVVEGGTGLVAGSGKATLCQDGWVRLSFSITSGTVPTSGTAVLFAFIDSDSALRLAGTATTGAYFDVFGLQYEAGGTASSFNPTYGVATTRADDSLSISIGSWYTQGTGTIYTRNVFPTITSSLFPVLVQIDENVGSNRVQLFAQSTTSATSGGVRIDVAGAPQVNSAVATTTNFGQSVKFVAAYATNNTRFVQNGGTVASDVVCTMPTGSTNFRVGKTTSAANFVRWVQEVRYYQSTSASDAQLQAITA
jgi:hypothetical protein